MPGGGRNAARAGPGYKAHFTETVSDPAADDPVAGRPEHPNIVTGTETARAAVPDAVMTGPVREHPDGRGLAPGEHLADSGYASADLLTAARQRGTALIAPLPAGTSRQARTGGYTADRFTADRDARQVTCPQGAVSRGWSPARQAGKDMIAAAFPAAACRPCPARDKCTTATRTGRQLTLRPRETRQAIAAARAEQATGQRKRKYAARAGVEGLMAQAAHVTGIRRARYPGLPKTTLEHNIAAVAINLIRLDAWRTGTPLDRTRTSHLQRLQLDLAA